MQTLDATSLLGLTASAASLRTAFSSPSPEPVHILPPFAHPPTVTPIVRGATTIGYAITPFLTAAPTSADAKLDRGTLWIDASLFGAAFASTAGFAGISFSSASFGVSGTVTFGASIVLAATATLRVTLASSVSTVTGSGGASVGADFIAATLTPFSGATIEFAPAAASIVLAGSSEATLYGQSLALTPGTVATPALLDSDVSYVAIPAAVAQTTFTVVRSTSPEVAVAGAAPIVGGGVLFPIFDEAPASLPDPADAWGVVVVTGAGLSATLAPLAAPLSLAGASFALTPARLVGLIANGAARVTVAYDLWTSPPSPSPAPATQPPLALPQSRVTLDVVPGALVSFAANPTQELQLAAVVLDAVVDRPLDASGRRIVVAGPAIATRRRTTSAIVVEIVSALTPAAATSLAIVAENALVPVGTPSGFLLAGSVTGATIAGELTLRFPASSVIPTFPDPYVAAYDTQGALEGVSGLLASIVWSSSAGPTLRIAPERTTGTSAAGATFGRGAGTAQLLDVSTNADLWGIALAADALENFSFDGLRLQAPASGTQVFTVPGISWEPVVDAVAAPAWLAASSPDDGIATTFLVAVAAPAPVVPTLALEQYQSAAGSVATSASFTLPFGITAALSQPGPMKSGAPAYSLPTIQFAAEGLASARVLTIVGAAASTQFGAGLPGSSTTGSGDTPPAYGARVLGTAPPSVAAFWDGDFGTTGTIATIPVGRIDLSGYGTTAFSDWHDTSTSDVGIVRALFNVLLGRTAHEIVTAQTWILPWCIRLQKTITFDRADSGEVVMHDTGWQAVGDGAFELLTGRILAGPVRSLTNVRNIVFAPTSFPVGSSSYTLCTFDANVVFAPNISIAANGKNPAPFAFGTAIGGFADDTVATSTTLNPAISAADIIALVQKTGRVYGLAGAIARVGGTGTSQFTMTATSFGAAIANGPTPMLQTAIFGTPHLPKDGTWSVTRRPSAATVPQTVDPVTPVPMTQGTSAGTTPPTGIGTISATALRLLDPEDAQNVNAPATLYGIMQGTGTSKTLYEHPVIDDAGTGIGFNRTPSLADVGALLGIASIFPDVGSALDISSTDGLPIAGDGFTRTYTWGPGAPVPSPAPADRSLLDVAIVHLALSYAAQFPEGTDLGFIGTLTLDASTSPTSWSLTMQNLSFVAKVDGFGTLLTVCGGFEAGSSTIPGFVGLSAPGAGSNLQVYYGPPLSAVQTLFSGLSGLAAALGGSADLDVGFSGSTLSVQQSFTLPTIPLGFGQITDLGIDLGFSATIPSTLSFAVGIGSQQEPFHWVVTPLSGTGAIVLGVQDGGLNCFIEAGLGIGISLSVAVASGSASIVVSLSLDIGSSEITIGAALTGNAEVDVLGGLASASLTLTAAIAISLNVALPPTEATLAAQVSVGIHISICWVISVSFDGSWGFSESISI